MVAGGREREKNVTGKTSRDRRKTETLQTFFRERRANAPASTLPAAFTTRHGLVSSSKNCSKPISGKKKWRKRIPHARLRKARRADSRAKFSSFANPFMNLTLSPPDASSECLRSEFAKILARYSTQRERKREREEEEKTSFSSKTKTQSTRLFIEKPALSIKLHSQHAFCSLPLTTPKENMGASLSRGSTKERLCVKCRRWRALDDKLCAGIILPQRHRDSTKSPPTGALSLSLSLS